MKITAKAKRKELTRMRQKQILDVAAEVFSKNGYARTQVDEIANIAGLGKGTVYRYFKNKKLLFLSVGQRGMDRLTETILVEIEKEKDPIKKIERAIRAYLTFFEANSNLARIFMEEQGEFKKKVRKRYFEYYYGHINKTREIFKSAIAQGLFKDVDVDNAISFLTSMLNGLIYMWQVEGMRYSLANKIPIILEIFFTGVINDDEKRSGYEFSKRR